MLDLGLTKSCRNNIIK